MHPRYLIILMAAVLGGCAVGPNYKRPDVPAPPQFRAGEQQPSQTSLGDMKWFDLFQDETLQGLVKEALQANYDIRIAAQRVLQAQGQLSATRSGLFPQLNAQAAASRYGTKSPIQSTGGGFGVASWEIDLFGRLRRATEAARADLLAVQENQNAVMQALVADVASVYFDLREYDAELEYVRESIKARQESVKLVAARVQGGVASALDLDQAKTLVALGSGRSGLVGASPGAGREPDQFPYRQAAGPDRSRQESDRPAPAAAGAGRLALDAAGEAPRREGGRAAVDRR